MQFLRQEKINHSTFSKWRRRYHAENSEDVKSEETLAPVSISHAKMPYLQKASYEELLEFLPHNWKHGNQYN